MLWCCVNFATFCSGSGVDVVTDQSLGPLAAVKSMLFCISFIDRLWRTTLKTKSALTFLASPDPNSEGELFDICQQSTKYPTFEVK